MKSDPVLLASASLTTVVVIVMIALIAVAVTISIRRGVVLEDAEEPATSVDRQD